MNKESNKYIILYAIGLVAVSAVLLSVATFWLEPFQRRNVELEKKQNILQVVHKVDGIDTIDDRKTYIESSWKRYIRESKIVNFLGREMDGDAFAVSMEKQVALPKEERLLPVFICVDDDSSRQYIFPVRGNGLWGPIWGYVALQSDANTVCGVIFDHKSETPGLGGEISTQRFQEQFIGKQLFDAATQAFTSVAVQKGGSNTTSPHAVDGVSGGTITSEGLSRMLADGLALYVPFLKEQQKFYAQILNAKVKAAEPQPTAPAIPSVRRPLPQVAPADTETETEKEVESTPAPVPAAETPPQNEENSQR